MVVVFTTTRAEEEGAKALWIVLITTAGIVGPAGSTKPKPTRHIGRGMHCPGPCACDSATGLTETSHDTASYGNHRARRLSGGHQNEGQILLFDSLPKENGSTEAEGMQTLEPAV